MAQENTNKAIIYNTAVLYGRLGITLCASLFTTRFALQALGDSDFGLISLVGSIVIFISIVNTTMLSASNRFIAAAIGGGDKEEINRTFNANLLIHITIALLTLIIALPGGYWYITHFVNYSGPIDNALNVFYISLVSSAVSFIAVPYNGLMIARERFLFFCLVEIFFALFKLGISYSLLFHFENKLIVYALTIGINTALPTIIYYIYCKKKFPETIRFRIVKDKTLYKEILSFSGYIGYGAFVQVGQAQGAAIIINAFFNTVMNTAFGIANYLKSAISIFPDNLTKPIAPQITKCYAAGNIERCVSLVTVISRVSFLITFIISIPFLTETEFIIGLWLGTVPQYSVIFSRLIIIEIIITAVYRGISEYIFATGKIKWYQIYVNTILFLSVVAGYIVLKAGMPAVSLLYVYIIFAVIANIVRLVILRNGYDFDIKKLFRDSYLPSFTVVLFSMPVFFVSLPLHPIFNILTYSLYVMAVIYFFGIKKEEKSMLLGYVKKRLLKHS